MRTWLIVLALALVMLAGCGGGSALSSSPSPSASGSTAAGLADEYGLHVLGGAMTIPDSLDTPPWADYQRASRDGGFDLRPYRGQKVTFTAHPLRERHGGSPATLWTIGSGDRIIGAYVTVDGQAPGIYSLREAAAGF